MSTRLFASSQRAATVPRPGFGAIPAQAISRVLTSRAEVAAVAAVGIVLVALVALTWNTWGDLAHDTGYDWLAAQRVADGALPYADFTYYYGPLGVYLLAGTFQALGATVGATVAFGLVAATLAVGLTYLVARQLTGPAGAAVAAMLAATAALATGNKGIVQPHSVSASVAIVLSLACLLAAAAHARSGERGPLVAAGVAAGLVALTRPEFLAAAVAALALWQTLRVIRATPAERRRRMLDGALCAAAALAVPLVVYGLIVTQVGLGALVNDNLLPRDELAAGGNDLLRAAAPLTAASVIEVAGRLALYAIGAAALVVVGTLLGASGRARRVAIAAVVLAFVGFVGALAIEPEALRSRLSLAYGWIPAGAVLAVVALTWLALRDGRSTRWAARDQVALLVASFTAVLAAKSYGAFFPQPNPEHAQSAIYALPFAAVFLVWLHAVALPRGGTGAKALGVAWVGALALAGVALTAHDASKETFTVRGPGGSIAAPPAQGPALQGALDAIAARTRRDDPILLAPQQTALYLLAERRNPLPQVSLLPGALGSKAQERDAIRSMARVDVVITDPRPRPEYGHGAFGVTYSRELGDWLRTSFVPTTTFGGAEEGALNLDLWQRNSP